MVYLRLLAVWMTFCLGLAAFAAEPVIVQLGERTLNAGKLSFVAEFQDRLNQLPEGCRPVPALTAAGSFGAGTKTAIQKAAACAELGGGTPIPQDSPARQGALTAELWRRVFPARALPTVHERTMILVLTQEATDYDRAEWNFCQNQPRYQPRGTPPQPACFSNDPKSFLTWGPRGATAGHGAEIQKILEVIDQSPDDATKALIGESFGPVQGDVRRLLKLNADDTERFLCGIWMDPANRKAWSEGFQRLGRHVEVAKAYDLVYASAGFDGGKITQYYRLYEKLGVVPSEVDYGFFVDRATQMSGPQNVETLAAKARAALGGGTLAPAQVRRWVAQNLAPGNRSLKTDRLGRDVVFYIDALEASLTLEELAAWKGRNRLRARDVGLTDSLVVPEFRAVPLGTRPPPRGTESLTAAERQKCPQAVLNPLPPR